MRAAALAAAIGLAGAFPSAAAALSQRGHVAGTVQAFGAPGEGDGQLQLEIPGTPANPNDIAVDEATGDVYVVDRGNHRVDEFGPAGEFVSAWGWGVANGEARYEVCTSECRAGLSGAGKGEIKEGGAIAVDNSAHGSHYVYVDTEANGSRPQVTVFTANGEAAFARLPAEEEGAVDGIAIDASGDVWLYRAEDEEEAVLEAFSDGEKPVSLEDAVSSPVECPKPGFAVNANGTRFYIAHELLTSEDECPVVAEQESGHAAKGAALRPALTAELQASEGGLAVLSNGLSRRPTAGVAVDEASTSESPLEEAARGDAYLAEGNSVGAYSAAGATVDQMTASGLEGARSVAVDARTGDVYAVDAATDRIYIFEPEPAGRPEVEELAAEHVTASEAEVTAAVNPHGAATNVEFEYGTAECPATPGCKSSAEGAVELTAAFGARPVLATLSGLEPDTTYHFRVTATNRDGAGSVEEQFGTLTTPPAPNGLLADDRAWELVSPPNADGSGIEPIAKEGGLIEAAAEGGAITYIADGPVEEEPAGNRAPEVTQVLSTRSPTAWSSKDLVTPHEKGEGPEPGEPSEYRFFTPDLALSAVQPPGGTREPLEAPPLAPGASEKTIYVRDDPPLVPAGDERETYELAEENTGFLAPGFLPLITPGSDTAGTSFGGKLDFLDASEQLTHVVFSSREAPLLARSAAGLYEWELSGALQLVSVLPDGAAAGNAELGDTPELGDEDSNMRGAVAAVPGGSRVVFYSEGLEEGSVSSQYKRLYVRDTADEQTVQLNAAQGVVEPVAESEASEVAFQGATSDGSKVFFTDTAPLTPESGQRPELESEKDPADLYECELTETAGRIACSLKDLTPVPAPGSAEVLNVVPGISENGSYVYFVANGALTPGAQKGDCPHEQEEAAKPGAACNLYLWHAGAITLIARLSSEDSGDWGSLHSSVGSGRFIEPRPDPADLTARVSPDGRYFAFMSEATLTTYNNADADHEGHNDEEVYLYDALTHRITCASCNSRGPSTGVYDTQHAGEGSGLFVDRREDWTGSYLAGSIPGWMGLGSAGGALYQPRYLSDSGRLFFDSPDDLVPQATNGKEDVYEYEPVATGTCEQTVGCVSLISSGNSQHESAFLDASETGSEAFFVTSQQLVAADQSSNFVLYDARACSDASPCLNSEPPPTGSCETAKSCNPATSSPPSSEPPGSSTSDSTGNVTSHENLPPLPSSSKRSSTRKKLAEALRRCRRFRDGRKRRSCERAAKRRYGPRTRRPAGRSGRRRRRER